MRQVFRPSETRSVSGAGQLCRSAAPEAIAEEEEQAGHSGCGQRPAPDGEPVTEQARAQEDPVQAECDAVYAEVNQAAEPVERRAGQLVIDGH